MAKFLFVYHGTATRPETEAEGKEAMDAWMNWFGALGSSVIDGGDPVGMSERVYAGGRVENNGGASPTMGYSVIEAADIDDAAEKAKGCPALLGPGNFSVEVAPIIDMS